MVRAFAPLLALVLGACTPAPVREAARPSAPTIVSLNPCTDAILAEVADPAQILALSHYSHDPASSSMDLSRARRFRSVSGSVEEVLALRPDLVLGSTFTAPATLAALDRLGLRFEAFGVTPDVATSEAQVLRLAELAGHPERGRALVERIEAALAASRSDGPPIEAIVWQSGGIVAGDDKLIADLLRRTGFRNGVAARGLGQAAHLPLEAMIARPPALILAAGNSGASEDRMLSHPALARLGGVRRESLDRSLLWCGGPTIVRAAARLHAIRASL